MRVFKILFVLLILAIAKNSFATESVIRFKVHGDIGSGVYCYQLEEGQPVSLGFKRPDPANGEGSFTIDLQRPAVFYIKRAGGKGLEFSRVLYLKPGDQKQLNLLSEGLALDYEVGYLDQPNVETMQLQFWLQSFNEIHQEATKLENRTIFYAHYERLAQKAGALIKRMKGDANFQRLFPQMIKTDLLFIKSAAFFFNNERLFFKYDSSSAVREFYRPLRELPEILGNTEILSSVNGVGLMRYVLAYNKFNEVGDGQALRLIQPVDYATTIANDTLRGIFMASYIPTIKTNEVFNQEIEPFAKYFYSARIKKDYAARKKLVSGFAKGDEAYNFSLKNVNSGQIVKLSDFRGKVVVLDVWAMWCGPCLAERPGFMKLESSFKKRKDIVFLGISVDGTSREAVLKGFLKKQHWDDGIELVSDFDKSIMEYYRIAGIPRFMVFDKAGKIVSVDAPRPSSPALKQMIVNTLEKK